MTRKLLGRFGVLYRRTGARALAALESAGLVSVDRHRYTHVAVADVAGALDRLPEIRPDGDQPEMKRATGTEGRVKSVVVPRAVPPDGFSGPFVSSSGPIEPVANPVQETQEPLKKLEITYSRKERARDMPIAKNSIKIVYNR